MGFSFKKFMKNALNPFGAIKQTKNGIDALRHGDAKGFWKSAAMGGLPPGTLTPGMGREDGPPEGAQPVMGQEMRSPNPNWGGAGGGFMGSDMRGGGGFMGMGMRQPPRQFPPYGPPQEGGKFSPIGPPEQAPPRFGQSGGGGFSQQLAQLMARRQQNPGGEEM